MQTLVESEPGQPLTEEKVATDLRRIFGTGDYEAISYRIVGDEGGPRAMLIEPTEKSWGPDYLRFGLSLASDFAGDNQFNVRAQYRRTWLNASARSGSARRRSASTRSSTPSGTSR